MIDSVIDNDMYLGPFLPTLQVGDVQRMCFSETDKGPFWLSPEQRLNSKYDCEISEDCAVKKHTKKNLLLFITTC